MKTIENYRADMLTILGDAGGRRYSPTMLDMGLREALRVYRSFCPRKETMTVTVKEVEGAMLDFGNALIPPGDVLTVRNAGTGKWLSHSEYRSGPRVYMTIGAGSTVPSVGEKLELEMSAPHWIRGLDEGNQTTVPDAHAVTVAEGGAGYAMRIRARSVTEVFGKRPEDRAALMEQADALEAEYYRDLERIARTESFSERPWL